MILGLRLYDKTRSSEVVKGVVADVFKAVASETIEKFKLRKDDIQKFKASATTQKIQPDNESLTSDPIKRGV